MKLRPLGDRVLIAPLANRLESPAGLEIVEHWKPEQMGTVVAVGEKTGTIAIADALAVISDEYRNTLINIHELRAELTRLKPAPFDVKAGDLVLFSWQAGQEIQDHDTDTRYLLLKEDDLIAVIEKELVPA